MRRGDWEEPYNGDASGGDGLAAAMAGLEGRGCGRGRGGGEQTTSLEPGRAS